ncbi:MAG: quinone-dependent dihydroorotate dehydrogenase [Blastocatellia bacterium]|nr:quinone-dependent dihydroorotate dehydrogenase [Blastocatellia bacterium]
MTTFYENLIRRAIFRLDAETAHEIGIELLRVGLSPEFAQRRAAARFAADESCIVERIGLRFASPIGVAAGFDKNGVVVNQLAALGFGFVEVGTVTFQPQPGNEKPRLFRLPDDKALINRLGFNNDGALAVAKRLRELDRHCVVGVNIGKNKDVPNEEATQNYLAAFDLVHDVADYVALNISSPNTPNLRELQRAENLESLISALLERNRVLSPECRRPISTTPSGAATGSTPVQERRLKTPAKPILVKIAPDLDEGEIEEIVDICIRLGISGIIATNTTVSREDLKTSDVARFGAGGLSGRPIAERSNDVIRSIFRHSGGKLPIIGVGGIFTAEDAFEKLAAGASLLQSYTGFIYTGPTFARELNRGIQRLLAERGYTNINAVIGIKAGMGRLTA